MKVKLLVNLKIADGSVVMRNTVFDNTEKEFPEHVTNNLNRTGVFEVLVKDAPAKAPAAKAPVAPAVKAPVEAPAKKKLLVPKK